MRRIFLIPLCLVVGFTLGTFVSVVLAKYESTSLDAMSVVGYGNYSGAIVAIQVDANGKVVLQ